MTEPYDPAVMQFLAGSRRPRLRTPERHRQKMQTEIDGFDALESEYQELLWIMGARFLTIEDARLAEFAWCSAGIGYDDLLGWYHQGAVIQDKTLMFNLAAAGVTADVTSRWWTSTARESVTVMRALLSRTTTVSAVVDLLSEGHLAGCSNGITLNKLSLSLSVC